MADLTKFEEMLERLVNEDKDGAEELFHQIVVEKSRDIYESLLEDEAEVDESDDEETKEAADEEVDESDEDLDEATDEEVDESDDDEETNENFDLGEFEVEADPMDMGGDATDDMMGDMEPEGDMDDEGEDDEVEDRVDDLEDALEDLKAEFEKMMAGDDVGDDSDDMDMDDGEDEKEDEAFAFEATDEEVDESDDTEIEEGGHSDQMIKDKENMSKAEFEKKYGDAAKDMDESAKSAGEQMREYVEKVSATMGDNGVNNKSPHASPNKMGDGTTANMLNAGEEKGGDHAGLADINAKEDNAGNINVPGGKASKASKNEPGHGAEKKGKPEAAADKKSAIGS
jgi:hypothetical protein